MFYAHNRIHIMSLCLESETYEDAIEELRSIVAQGDRLGWMITEEEFETMLESDEIYLSNSPTH